MKKKDLLFLAIILGLALLFFSRILFGSYLFAYRDFHRYFYPTRLFTASWIREGIIPLWNPYLHSGIPHLANLQSAIFYPFSLLAYLLPYHLSLKLFVVIQLILAGFFMYLFLKELKISETASFVGSITFIFSGYVFSTLDMLIYLSTLMWAPLVFLFFNKALDSGIRDQGSGISFKWAVLCGISLALMFLGADPTGLYQTLWALLFFAIAKGIVRSQKSEVGGRRSEVGGRRSEVGGRRSEVGGRRSEVGSQRSEVRGRRSEVRGRRSEVRSRKSEVGGQRSEVGSRKSDVRYLSSVFCLPA